MIAVGITAAVVATAHIIYWTGYYIGRRDTLRWVDHGVQRPETSGAILPQRPIANTKALR